MVVILEPIRTMKILIITVLISLAAIGNGFAQCEDNSLLVSTKTNLADPEGNPTGVKDETTTLRFSKTKITLNIDGVDRGELKVISQACNWTIPYKEGKSVIKVVFNDSDYTLTIEGKDSNVTLRVVKENSDDSILTMTADKFEKVPEN